MRSTYVLYSFSQFSNNLFYLFPKLALFCYRKIWLIIYSLNLALCLHLAFSSFLLFNNLIINDNNNNLINLFIILVLFLKICYFLTDV